MAPSGAENPLYIRPSYKAMKKAERENGEALLACF